MANDALNTNSRVGQQADLGISARASDWYFAVCAIMAFSTLVFLGMGFTKRETHRIFHYITATITFIACIAYFSMGAGLGQVPIQVEFPRNNSQVGGAGTREIYYVRYIDWFITTPLLLLDLLLTAGMPWPSIMIALLADEIMVVTGLVGALTSTSYKWGYWVFGMFAFFYVVYALVIDGRKHAGALGGQVSSTYRNCGVLTIFLWFLYPIAWGVSEGGNLIHPDSEAVFYGILDVLAKPGFGFLLLWGHRNIDPTALGLHIREAGQPKNRPVGSHDGDHGHIGGAGPSNGL
ncbi:bacteriorhodopsin [Colletotrichum costaricense]|uniref:Opsin-like protein carO n=1 Tax=Colletotrichum costaricense TaxID=1209916 RepID=A0AAJ0DTG8_9PEZI|nr:bacteriorhodopsin [Colletotrichum costaricense]KAK1509267.1 bacteriorhodopsin [Colletotrichum costaricense]